MPETMYLVELPDGSSLSVPESKLQEVSSMSSEDLNRPLNRAERRLLDRLKQRISTSGQ